SSPHPCRACRPGRTMRGVEAASCLIVSRRCVERALFTFGRGGMRMRIIAVALLVGVAAGAGAAPPGPSTVADDRDAVLATVDACNDAGLRRDAAALARLYTEGYFHVNPDGSIL